MGVIGGWQDQGAGATLEEPFHNLVHVTARRLVAGHPVTFQVPADGFGTQDITLQAEFGLAHRDLLLVVEPGGRDVPLAGEHEHFNHRQPTPNGVFVHQASGRDRPVVRMGTEHDQRPIRPQDVTQRFPNVDELAVAALTAHGFQQALEIRTPVARAR